jgi:DNA-binding transcriptional LysR family regulator
MAPEMKRGLKTSRRLKLRQLEVLIAVAQSGNMAKAAEQLCITQPVISKTISELETMLRVRLFDRSRRGVEPTVYGNALLKRSLTIFNDLQTGVDELEYLSDPTAGVLRIGSSEALAAGMLGVIIDRLSRRHPLLSFQATLGGGLADLQYRELQAHSIDLIIGRLPRVIPEDLKVVTLFEERFCFVAGLHSKLAHRRRIQITSLLKEPWCLPSLDVFPWSLIADAFRARKLDLPSTIVTARSILLQNSLLLTGRFVGVLPHSVLHFSAKPSQLKSLSLDLTIPPYPVGILILKNRTLSPAAEVFIECSIESAKSLAIRK